MDIAHTLLEILIELRAIRRLLERDGPSPVDAIGSSPLKPLRPGSATIVAVRRRVAVESR